VNPPIPENRSKTFIIKHLSPPLKKIEKQLTGLVCIRVHPFFI
jgi:hypothetical protein